MGAPVMMGGRIGETIEFYYLDTEPMLKVIIESGSGHAVDLKPAYTLPAGSSRPAREIRRRNETPYAAIAATETADPRGRQSSSHPQLRAKTRNGAGLAELPQSGLVDPVVDRIRSKSCSGARRWRATRPNLVWSTRRIRRAAAAIIARLAMANSWSGW